MVTKSHQSYTFRKTVELARTPFKQHSGENVNVVTP